jgi:hypothetical protein
MAGCRDLADIAMASGLLRFERPLVYLPSAFRRLHTRLRVRFVYTRFSQTSTREKKLAGETPRLGINGRTVVGGSSAYPRSVPLGGIDELGLSPGRRERQSTGL